MIELNKLNGSSTISRNRVKSYAHSMTEQPKPPKPSQKRGFGSNGGFDIGESKEKDSLFIAPEEQILFPLESFPLDIRRMIKEVSRVAQVPECLAGSIALACLSASLGSRLRGEMVSEKLTTANLYILGIAKSGTGKGRTFSLLNAPLKQSEKEETEAFYASIRPQIESQLAKTEEKRGKAFSEGDEAEAKKLGIEVARLKRQLDSKPTLFCDDITKEALIELISKQENESLASFSSEARGLVDNLKGRYNQAGNSDESVYCSLYSGDEIKVHRKTGGVITLDSPCLSLCWLLQPDSASKLSSDPAMIESGLMPRFMVFNAHAELQDEPDEILTIPEEVKENWRNTCLSLLAIEKPAERRKAVSLTHEAYQVLKDFSNKAKREGRENGVLRDMAGFASRYGENARKIALCLHAGEYLGNSYEVKLSEETAKKAVALMSWYVGEQLSFLGDIRFSRAYSRAKELETWLRRKEGRKATMRDVKRNLRSFSLEEIEALSHEFSSLITVSEKISPKGGRPSIIVSLSESAI